jgi:hypothetical protein
MGTDNVSIIVKEAPIWDGGWCLNVKIAVPAGDYGAGISKEVYVYGR